MKYTNANVTKAKET